MMMIISILGKILLCLVIVSIMYLLSLIICVSIVVKFPHSKLGNWIRRNVITDEDLENTYKQVRNELGSYSKDLLEKKEIIVLNKTDLLEEEEVKEILKKFSKNKYSEVVTLSTLEKGSISKIKAKLLSYVS